MLVWYAAYGSNLLRARFLTYLQGGPVPGSGRIQGGARDPGEPRDNRPFRIEHPLVFAQRSRTWRGGGVCFVDSAPGSNGVGPVGARSPAIGTTAGRVWLLTTEQFSDVWAQENGIDVGVDLDIAHLVTAGTMDVGSRWYRRLLSLGELEGMPVVTFTCASATNLNPGDSSYLGVVGRGLMETWGWSAEQAAHYLAGCRGNLGEVEAASLISLLDAEPIA